MDFANADVAVCVYHGAEPAGETGNNLGLTLNRLHLGPLQHGLYNRSIAAGFAARPQTTNIAVQILVTPEVGPRQRAILTIASNDREIMMVHMRTAFKKIRG